MIAYHTSDALWGVINDTHNAPLLYADTVIYFVLMALSVLLWSNFVMRYLEREDQVDRQNDRFGRVLNIVGRGFFAFQIAALLVNIVVPLLFSVDWSGEYHAGVLRHMTFLIQMGMFLFTSAYALSISRKTEGAVKRRHRTIALLGLAMSTAIAIQLYFPLLPMYSIGYMLGCCALHTFVVEDEKAEYLLALEESIQREGKQRKELSAVRSKAYSDPLTGVKSKHAYMDAADYIHRRIMAGDVKEFAVAVFDLNGLKQINDTQGHDAGDQYIKEGCSLICEVFSHSPVYRIGGDEFVAIMEGRDYGKQGHAPGRLRRSDGTQRGKRSGGHIGGHFRVRSGTRRDVQRGIPAGGQEDVRTQEVPERVERGDSINPGLPFEIHGFRGTPWRLVLVYSGHRPAQ
ncbi:MAG: GGDEF domain-containing protein [Oscillibacter sp.]|nr:GGDEF domain-containing protein [Oscillibacter sp.]